MLERLSDGLLRLGSWAAAAAGNRASGSYEAMEALHDAFVLEAVVRIANPLARLACRPGSEGISAWPLQLSYRCCVAAAALGLGALPAAAAAVDQRPPPPPGQDEPDNVLVCNRIDMSVCYTSDTLDTLCILGCQIDDASDAKLLAGLRLVAQTCRYSLVNTGEFQVLSRYLCPVSCRFAHRPSHGFKCCRI